jgi:hypothetical protein
VYRQQGQADQQKQIIAQMAGKMPSKSNDGKRKNTREIITNPMEDAVVLAKAILAAEDAEDVEEAVVDAVEEQTIVAKRVTIPLTAHSEEKNDNEQSNMVSKSDFKNLFQSSLKEMLTKKEKQSKKNAEGDDDSLDTKKLMEGKHTKIVNKRNDDLMSINDTDTFDYSMQDKITHKNCEDNNYNNDFDELAYPFSKRIKLKHEPEKAQENVPVQYTSDIIAEIKNRDGTVVPMIALLGTGTTAKIILR